MKKTPIKTIEKEIRTACKGHKLTTGDFRHCALGVTYGNEKPQFHIIDYFMSHWNRTEGEIWCFIYGFDGKSFSDMLSYIVSRGKPLKTNKRAMHRLGVRLRNLLP